jgi:quercetin dioxygenase-like cupin family protein
MSDYTIKNLAEVKDAAAAGGLDFGSVRFPRTDVDAEATGFVHQTLNPGARQPFGHRHDRAEEVVFVVSGSGQVKLDDGVHELREHDILRLAPHVTRSFAAGPEGLEFLVFGAHHEGDGELIQDYWNS